MTREEAIEILSLARFTGSSASELDAISEALDVAIEALKDQRPHGEWKKTDNRWGVGTWQCTHCESFYEIATKFCPNCGASMKVNDKQVTGKLKQPCPCDTCQTAIDRCGCQMHLCSDYQKWKEGEAE